MIWRGECATAHASQQSSKRFGPVTRLRWVWAEALTSHVLDRGLPVPAPVPAPAVGVMYAPGAVLAQFAVPVHPHAPVYAPVLLAPALAAPAPAVPAVFLPIHAHAVPVFVVYGPNPL